MKRRSLLQEMFRRGRFAIAAAFATVGIAGVARGQGLTEFTIPTPDGQPAAITPGPDGALWFTESTANKIGRISTSGVVTELSLPTADSFPDGITAGPDGNLWFTETGANKIGRITPGGSVTEFAIPTANAGPRGITAGPDGSLWFTEQNFDRIGRITTQGVVTEFPVPQGGGDAITAGSDGAIWFAYALSPASDPSRIEGRIARITPSGAVTEFSIPTSGVFSQAIASGPDGALWFTEDIGFGGKIGRITTAGVITEFPIPAVPGLIYPAGVPGGIAAGPDGALWFVEIGGIGRITTAGIVTQFLAPNASSGPAPITTGPDGNLWFLEGVFTGGTKRIGRIGPAACPLSPTLLCLGNSRFKAEATWLTADGRGGSGQARLLTQDTGYLWFFSASNPELMVKALNGCSINGRFWIFAAGLTNLNVALKITDLLTGDVKTYGSAQGAAFQSIQDTSAFVCP